MTGLERKAALKAAVTLHQTTMAKAAATFGISYNHLTLVLAGERRGSARLQECVASFVGLPVATMFGEASPTQET